MNPFKPPRYVLEVTTLVHDPVGEPVKLGTARYRVRHEEITLAKWPMVASRPLMADPQRWYLPSVDGHPSGALVVEMTLHLDTSDREVRDPD